MTVTFDDSRPFVENQIQIKAVGGGIYIGDMYIDLNDFSINTIKPSDPEYGLSRNVNYLKAYIDTVGIIQANDRWQHIVNNIWVFVNPKYSAIKEGGPGVTIDGVRKKVVVKEGTSEIIGTRDVADTNWKILPDGRRHKFTTLYKKNWSSSPIAQRKFVVRFTDKKISFYDPITKLASGVYYTSNNKQMIWRRGPEGYRPHNFGAEELIVFNSWVTERSKKGENYLKYNILLKEKLDIGSWLIDKHPILKDSRVSSNILPNAVVPVLPTLTDYCKHMVGISTKATRRLLIKCNSPGDLKALKIAVRSKKQLTEPLWKFVKLLYREVGSNESVALFTEALTDSCIRHVDMSGYQERRLVTDTFGLWEGLVNKPVITCNTIQNTHEFLLEFYLKQSARSGRMYHYKYEYTDEDTKISFRTPNTTNEVDAWGKCQHHCIGTYGHDLLTILLEIRHPDKEICHGALSFIEGHGWNPTQVYHKYNKKVDDDYARDILSVLVSQGVYLSTNKWGSNWSSEPVASTHLNEEKLRYSPFKENIIKGESLDDTGSV